MIGKRVADVVSARKDMTLVGVSDVVGDWHVRMAGRRRIRVYCSLPERLEEMRSGVEMAGSLDNLLNGVYVIVDCAPSQDWSKE